MDDSILFSCTVSAVLFLFFSGWSKETGFVSVSRISDLVLLRKGLLKTCKELNKLAGVLAITLLGLCALFNMTWLSKQLRSVGLASAADTASAIRLDVAWHATLIASLHVTFSMWNWYSFNPLRVLQHKRWFVISVGALAFAVLACSRLVRSAGLSADRAVPFAFLLGVSHLLLFSIDASTGAIDARPVVWIPLLIAPVVLAHVFFEHVWN